MERVEPVAYGLLALKPWEFRALTPGEYRMMHDGAVEQRDETLQTAVSLTCLILQGFGAKVKPADILGIRFMQRQERRAERRRQGAG